MSSVITYFEIAAFVSAWIAWPQLRKSKYMWLFPFLLLIVVAVEAHQTFFRTAPINAHIYNALIPLQYLFYLAILWLSLKDKRFRKFVLASTVLFIILACVSVLFLHQKGRINTLMFGSGSIAIIIAILLKFYDMLENPVDYNFLKNPFFYILFAYLFFRVGTLPYFTMGNWLYYDLDRPDIVGILVSVMSVFNCILYGTYTIVFLWIALRKESC